MVNILGMSRQRIVPYLQYADAPAAIDFLCRAFGFTETLRYPMPDGRIGHAELRYGESSVYLATVWRDAGFVPPRELEGVSSQIVLLVDDVDAHFARAKAGGATLASEPADQAHGARMYRAIDPEGHRWIVEQELRDVPVAEWSKEPA